MPAKRGRPIAMTDEQKKIIGKRVYELRRRLDFTQGELSEKSGISVSQLSKVEKGIISVPANKRIRLCDALLTTPEQLYSVPDSTEPPANFTPLEQPTMPTPTNKLVIIARLLQNAEELFNNPNFTKDDWYELQNAIATLYQQINPHTIPINTIERKHYEEVPEEEDADEEE